MKRLLLPLFLATSLTASAVDPAADPAAGQAAFQNLCQSCHGASGKGDGPAMADAYLKPRDFALGAYKFDTDADWTRGSDADLANVIRNGPQAYGGSALMPPWPNLTDDEVANLVAYVRTLENQQPARH